MRRQRASNWALISSVFFFSSSVSSSCRPSFVQHTSLCPSYSLSCCTAYSSIGSTMKKHLEAPLLEALNEGRVLHRLLGLASDVVDVLLALLHASHVVAERRGLVARLGGVVAQELGDLAAVVAVLMDPKLEVLPERLVELVEVVLVLGDLGEHLQLGDLAAVV